MLQRIINLLNDLRPRQLLVLAAAAGFLMFVTIIMAMKFITKQEVVVAPPVVEEKAPPPAETKVETKAVVVAKVNIPPRTRLQEGMLQMKELPADMVPEGAITSLDDVKNVQVKVSIFAGDILTIQKVFSESTNEGFVGEIPPNCRAVSITVSEVTGVAGFAKPGDKVDLLLVEKDKYSVTTNLILQNVPLLSVNQDTTGSNVLDENGIVKSSAISNPTIATFALPPQDILKLIAAANLGEIYMMLRPAHPQSNYVEAMQYTLESVNKPLPEQPVQQPQQPVQAPAESQVPKIEIILGDQVQTNEKNQQNPATGQNPTKSAVQQRSTATSAPVNQTPSFPNIIKPIQ